MSAAAVQEVLERELGVRVTALQPAPGGDINEAFRAETTEGPLFVKTRAGAVPGTFRSEAAGLRWLGEPGAIRTPAVRLVHDPPAGDLGPGDARLLALKWIDRGVPSGASDEALGRGLAAVHGAGAPAFGAEHPMIIGDVVLPNDPAPTFAEFFAANRIVPLAERSHAAGRLSADGTALMHRLAGRLPELAGPDEPPARIHGDLWSGNTMVDGAARPYLIDPVAHGGHREVDLATLRLFGAPGRRCFDAYDEAFPLAAGHEERVGLWQLSTLLLHVLLFGGGYERQALAVAGRYV